jgi:hypothetical protein
MEWHNGNLGLSRNLFFYKDRFYNSGFRLGLSGFDNYFDDPFLHSIYLTYKPYTEVSVVLGSAKEQIARVLHSQNINEHWNLFFKMNRTSSEGVYSRQNSNFNTIELQSTYKSSNKKYAAIIKSHFNRANAFENGGFIDSVDVLNSEAFINAKGIPVKLLSARRRVNENIIFIEQFYNILSKDSVLNNDSLFEHRSFVRLGFSNVSSVTRKYNWYKDDEPYIGFYNSYKDSLTVDSIRNFRFSDEFKIHFYLKNFEFNSGVRYEFNQLHMISYDTLAQNFIALASTNWKMNDAFNVKLKGNYVLEGFNKNDWLVSGLFSYAIASNWNSELLFRSDARTPTLQSLRWQSNNFEWSYNFLKEQITNISYKIENAAHNFNISASSFTIRNAVFYDFVARPKQYNGNASIIQGQLEKNFKLGKFNLTNTICYQKASNDSIYRLPELISKNAFFFETDLFKKAMKIQFGIDFYYFSQFTPYAYMPATNVYYMQQGFTTGNYPSFDLFLNFKVKTLRGFVMLDHFNEGLNGRNYFLMQGYAMPGRTLKFGLKWVFKD